MVSALDLLALVRAAAKLDKAHRPAAIGIDLPVYKQDKQSNQSSYSSPIETPKLLAAIKDIEKEVPIVMGVEAFSLDLKLVEAAKGFSNFASALMYRKDDIAVMSYGAGGSPNLFKSLGISVALEAAKAEGDLVTSGHAFGPRHVVEPPKEWSQKTLPALTWMYVDYSFLANREDLTVVAGEGLIESQEVSSENIFNASSLEKLKSDGKPTIWFVGIAKVPEAEDTFTYDEHLRWNSEAVPLRRIFQHGAIAQTYLERPLVRFDEGLAKWLDFFLSLVSLGIVLAIDKWLPILGKHELLRAIVKVAFLVGSVGAAVGISYWMALRGVFWFGFAGTALYALLEGFIGPIFEAIIGLGHGTDETNVHK